MRGEGGMGEGEGGEREEGEWEEGEDRREERRVTHEKEIKAIAWAGGQHRRHSMTRAEK